MDDHVIMYSLLSRERCFGIPFNSTIAFDPTLVLTWDNTKCDLSLLWRKQILFDLPSYSI